MFENKLVFFAKCDTTADINRLGFDFFNWRSCLAGGCAWVIIVLQRAVLPPLERKDVVKIIKSVCRCNKY